MQISTQHKNDLSHTHTHTHTLPFSFSREIMHSLMIMPENLNRYWDIFSQTKKLCMFEEERNAGIFARSISLIFYGHSYYSSALWVNKRRLWVLSIRWMEEQKVRKRWPKVTRGCVLKIYCGLMIIHLNYFKESTLECRIDYFFCKSWNRLLIIGDTHIWTGKV